MILTKGDNILQDKSVKIIILVAKVNTDVIF